MKYKIENLINAKIKEHLIEIEGCETEIKKIQSSAKTEGPNIEQASKVMILKDKLVFHKACKAVLQDLKNDVEKLE